MQTISTPNAPEAIGPYSQAVAVKGLVFCSGQIPINPATGEFCGTEIREQTRQVLRNLGAVLTAAGARPDTVVKSTVFLADMGDFAGMNEIYAEFFGDHMPARATVEVSRLPKNVLVEIECIAVGA